MLFWSILFPLELIIHTGIKERFPDALGSGGKRSVAEHLLCHGRVRLIEGEGKLVDGSCSRTQSLEVFGLRLQLAGSVDMHDVCKHGGQQKDYLL